MSLFRAAVPLFAFLSFAGCTAQEAPPEPLFAPVMAETWTLQETGAKQAADAPEAVQRFAILSYQTARYEQQGGATVHVQVFELAADAAGLHLEQTWVPTANTVAFHRGKYFAIVQWDGPREQLNPFVRDLGLRLSR